MRFVLIQLSPLQLLELVDGVPRDKRPVTFVDARSYLEGIKKSSDRLPPEDTLRDFPAALNRVLS